MISSISTAVDSDGIAVLTWDLPDSPVNKLTETSLADFEAAFRAAAGDNSVVGIVLASAKSDFIAGADLSMLQRMTERPANELFGEFMHVHSMLRFVETCKKPVVAAISGSALGGGLELALACHHRVVAQNPRLKIGFPEVTFGIFPGAGGTQRLPRLVKLQDALRLLTEGKLVGPEEALRLGIVHKVVATESVLDQAKAYIKDGGAAQQPWDQPSFRLPSGEIHSAQGFETFVGANGLLGKLTYGNYPAPIAILECVYHGLQLNIEEGCTLEARKFTKVVRSDVAKNMIRTMFFSMNDANKLKDRPQEIPPQPVKRLGVLGAGLMGSGIAYSSAVVGIDVTLVDSTQELAEKGKAACGKILENRVEKGQITREQSENILNRIRPTTDFEMLADCSLIIEAVFEDRKVKAEVMKKVDAVAPTEAIIGSNTSSLPISSLSETVGKSREFIGIHFFSPVDKMQLVEVIRGRNTSDRAVALTLDYVQQIKKTPIVVNDGRGFFTTRVFSTYTSEGINLLAEGQSPALIENAGRMAGMPMGPLEVADMVGLDTVQKITAAAKEDLGQAFNEERIFQIVTKLVKDEQRLGKKNGKGFYDYVGKYEKKLWKGLIACAVPDKSPTSDGSFEELKNRLLIIQALEALRCLEERVVLKPADADVGSILGWGFCPFYGGIASYVDTVGTGWLLEQANRLSKTVGSRFDAPMILQELGKDNKSLYKHEWEARQPVAAK